MTRPLVLDFETYFDSKYTLRRKSNTMSTSLYIRDSRFLAHCVSVWLPEEEEFPRLYWYDDIAKALKKYPWKQIELICHHTHFDGLILSHHYGIIPQRYGCTLSMARAWHGADTPADLGTLAQWHGFQNKLVDISALAKGVRFFEPGVKRALFGDYCKADTANTWFVRQSMLSQGFPSAEMDLIERTIRMFADPILRVDRKLAESELLRERTEKEQKIEVAGVPVDDLQSAEAFANLLRERGVEPPIKVSARTGEETYAFAKTDLMFQKLLGHEDEDVRELIEARLAAKSTIGETRAAAIIARSYKTIVVDDETKTLKGRGTALLPIYVNFAKAHTLRWSGGDKFNPQNLTAARGKRKHVKIRHCIKAPPGHKLVILDSSQIELRVNAMLHDEKWLLKALREKRDVYSEFATSFYGRTITKKDEIERFVGKTCLAEGSLVLSSRGWVPIEAVQLTDQLWDGEEWVCHSGVVSNGSKPVLKLSGLSLTPDHLVWCGTEWKEARYLAHDENILSQALGIAAVSLPSLDISVVFEAVSHNSSFAVTAGAMNTPLIRTASSLSVVRDAISVLWKKLARHAKHTGVMLKRCLMTSIEHAYSTASQQPLLGATLQPANTTPDMAVAGSRSVRHGETTGRSSLSTFRLFLGGITPRWKWTGQTTTEGTNPATFSSSLDATTQLTSDKSTNFKQKCNVYDVLSCGPRNRFVALTERGPLIVHNCTLGLGFGMGAPKLRYSLAIGSTGPAVFLSLDESKYAVDLWRKTNSSIVAGWYALERLISVLAVGSRRKAEYGPLRFEEGLVHMPNGLALHYPEMRLGENGWTYRLGRAYKRMWGGIADENFVQSLARIIVGEQLARVPYRLAMTSHDEFVFCVPAAKAKDCYGRALEAMSTPPKWWPSIPLAAEGHITDKYDK